MTDRSILVAGLTSAPDSEVHPVTMTVKVRTLIAFPFIAMGGFLVCLSDAILFLAEHIGGYRRP